MGASAAAPNRYRASWIPAGAGRMRPVPPRAGSLRTGRRSEREVGGSSGRGRGVGPPRPEPEPETVPVTPPEAPFPGLSGESRIEIAVGS